MKFYSQERVALFIDGATLYATARSLGFDIDYKRLLNIFSAQSNLIRWLYYTALVQDQRYSTLRHRLAWLDNHSSPRLTTPHPPLTDQHRPHKVQANTNIN